MKVTVSQAQLAHGLGVVSRAVSPRSTLPVLGNILIATDEGRLRLSATNLELGITCWIPATIAEEGAVIRVQLISQVDQRVLVEPAEPCSAEGLQGDERFEHDPSGGAQRAVSTTNSPLTAMS